MTIKQVKNGVNATLVMTGFMAIIAGVMFLNVTMYIS